MRSTQRKRDRSGWRIAMVGTGGQGVLTAARLLCEVFVDRGHDVVSGQLHGMAQRGGSVLATVMIDAGISPVMPSGKADIVVGLEPVETARALPLMSSHTSVLMNLAPIVPYVIGQRQVLRQDHAEYPDVDLLQARIGDTVGWLRAFDATRHAVELGALKSLNMVMLGGLLGTGLLPCPVEDFWRLAEPRIPARLRAVNTEAFSRGLALVRDGTPTRTGVSG